MVANCICSDKCERTFKSPNQHHICIDQDFDRLFEGRPDELVEAFDKLLVGVIDWPDCTVGASTKTIVFAKGRAWLIVRPMRDQLDLKFYSDEKIEHGIITKLAPFRSRWAHHVRIKSASEIDNALIRLLHRSWADA